MHGTRVLEAVGKFDLVGRILADLGADVVKLEPVDDTRARKKPPLAADGQSIAFQIRNANKRSVSLPAGEAENDSVALLLSADVLLCDDSETGRYARGQASDVRRSNPGLIVMSISDFGSTGPSSGLAATDAVQLAIGSQLSKSGIAGHPPLIPPGAMAYDTSAVLAVWAVLVSLHNRKVTGRGDTVDFSAHEATVQVMDPPFGTIGTATQGIAKRQQYSRAALERGRPATSIYPIFKCVDGYVRVAVLAARQWHSMRQWLGEPDDLQDPHYDTIHGRQDIRELLDARYARHFESMSMHEAAREGQRRGIPVSPVLSVLDVMAEEHFAQRGVFTDAILAENLPCRLPAGYFELDGTRIGYRHRAPNPGEHTKSVLSEWAANPPVVADGRATVPRRPLEGIRIVDFGIVVVGAELGRMFADLGAEVIRIESAQFPDNVRVADHWETGVGPGFAIGHRNMKSFGVNLRTAEGVALVKELVATADIVASNYKPGTLEKLGLGYDDLRAVKPDLVWVSSSGFGHTGPWSKWLGYGPLVRSASGLTSLWSYEDEPGAFGDCVTVYPDHLAGCFGAVAALAGLLRRDRTNVGAELRLAQCELVINQLTDAYVEAALSGRPPKSSLVQPPWGVFECDGDDAWCVIEATDDEQWTAFCDAIGQPQLAGEPRYQSQPARAEHADELRALIGSWTRQHVPEDVVDILQAVSVPSGVVRRKDEVAKDPQLTSAGFFVHLVQPSIPQPLLSAGRPFHSDGIIDPDVRPAPELGEHSSWVCTELLGKAPAQVADLIDRGVVEVASYPPALI
ncbi:hypothetical protein ASJ79_00220 [Mycobacterium sp. NAZ190054]|nr:hypothetical protein ASJ79_00220 [Mycobacterium sp. NAZ190054]